MSENRIKSFDDITRIRIEDHKTYYTCQGAYVIPLCSIFKNQNISYKYYTENNIPDGAPQYALFGNEKLYINIGCFESYANIEDLKKIIEELPYLTIKESITESEEESDGW